MSRDFWHSQPTSRPPGESETGRGLWRALWPARWRSGDRARVRRHSDGPGSPTLPASVSELTLTIGASQVQQPEWPRHFVVAPRPGPVAVTATTTGPSWGWFPLLSLLSALALVAVAIGHTGARLGAGWAESLFWLGVLALYGPVTMRLAGAQASPRERLALVALLGLSLYGIKVMHSPLWFTFHDEFLHWRTAWDLYRTGYLTYANPLLPASVHYPGLELLTVVVADLSGMSIFGAGLVVVGLARLVLAVMLFLIYERLSQSARVAGLASALYMTHPNFVYFDAQFSYESLALPIAAVALWLILRRHSLLRAGRVPGAGLTLAIALTIVAVAATHHLTSYLLAGLLLLWLAVVGSFRFRDRLAWLLGLPADWQTTFTARWLRRGWGGRRGPVDLALFALLVNLNWLLLVATPTLEYLGPVASNAGRGVLAILTGAGEQQLGRQLFQSSVGQVVPLWQRTAAIGAVLLILAGLPVGLLIIWRRYRHAGLVLTLALTTFIYPVSLVMRFAGTAWEVANRSSAFLWLGISLALALAIIHLSQSRRRWARVTARLAGSIGAAVLLVGGIVTGWPPAWHMPGPYLVGADARSIEPQGIATATWARSYLGPGNRMAADRINHLLMGSYGEQWVVSTLSGGVDSSWVFYSDEIGEEELKLLEKGEIRYIVVDRRLTSAPPLIEAFSGTDPRRRLYSRTPLDPALLDKFETMPGSSRIFDSGDIVIYDLGALADEP